MINPDYSYQFIIYYELIDYKSLTNWLFANVDTNEWTFRFDSRRKLVEYNFASNELYTWIKLVWGHLEVDKNS